MKKENKRWLRMLQELGVISDDLDLSEKDPIEEVIKAYDIKISERDLEALKKISKKQRKK